ncbi:MAG: fructosamine kinase family protein [Rhodovibrionaceae bacterium]
MTASGLAVRVEALLGARPLSETPLGGDSAAQVLRLELPGGGSAIAKRGPGAALEARMLTTLGERGGLPVPRILHAEAELLLMEEAESGGSLGPAEEETAAGQIAALHEVSAEQGFGFEVDTVIAGLPQVNTWQDDWIGFFRERRLLAMGRLALERGRLPRESFAKLERLAERLEELLVPGPSSLLHGDLWGGNVLAGRGGRLTYIDPAVYFGHAEIELAFSTLFGTFGKAFFRRYRALRPIAPGFFEQRCEIYNLYPLLVHSALFGGSYPGAVRRTLDRYL